MNQKILSLLFALFPLLILAQTSFSGTVLDAETKEVLPFVSIQTLPGSFGTTSDFDGNFSINSKTAVQQIVFTSLGYEKYVYETNGKNAIGLIVELKTTGIQIEETVVTAKRKRRKIPKDTAAISLQQQVVDNKEKNRPKSFDSYQFKEHTKIEFDYYKIGEKFRNRIILKPFRVVFDYIDSTKNGVEYVPLALQEKLTQNYYRQSPKQEKIKELGKYMTGVQNMSATVMLDEIFENLDLYDNIIITGGKSFTSPFSTTGLMTYRYYLTDTVQKDGKDYYQLNFYPKNNQNITFQGFALIDPSSFAIKFIEFEVPKKANINFVTEFVISQEFEEALPGKWIMKGEYAQIALNPFNRKKGKQVMVRKNMNRGDIIINEPIPDEVFEGEKIETPDSLYRRSNEWWASNRVQALNSTEAGIIEMSDSVERTRAYKNIDWLIYTTTTAFLKAGPVEIGRFYQLASFNSVEGFRPKFGIRSNHDFNKNIQLWGYLAYGTKDKKFKPFANVRIMLPHKNDNWHTFELNYKKDYTFLGQDYDDIQFSHDNLFLGLLRTEPLEKIILMENLTASYEREWVKGYTTKLSIGPKAFFAVPGVFDFEHEEANGTVSNYEQIRVAEISLNQHFGFGQVFFENYFYRFESFSFKPVIDINYTAGLKGILDSEFNYHKLELNYRHRLSSKLGFTHYNVDAGKIFGDVPYPLMFIPIGNQSFYFNSRAYQLMREFEFVADEYVSTWIEHHFDGLIFNRIPGVKKLNLRSLISVKAIIGNVKQSNLNIVRLPNEMTELENWYVEAGFGIENILNLARFDFYWRLTQRDTPDVQKFGVRFSIRPKL